MTRIHLASGGETICHPALSNNLSNKRTFLLSHSANMDASLQGHKYTTDLLDTLTL